MQACMACQHFQILQEQCLQAWSADITRAWTALEEIRMPQKRYIPDVWPCAQSKPAARVRAAGKAGA